MLQESKGKIIEKNSSMCTDFKIGLPGPTIRVEFFNEKLTLEILQYSNLLSWSVKGKYIKVSLNQRSCFWVLKTTSTLIENTTN